MHGGHPLEAAEDGTLGCFARLKNDATKVFILTAHHNLYGSPAETGEGTAVGSPTIKSSWPCRTNVIAHVTDGLNNEFVDCGIAGLDAKIEREYEQAFPGIGEDENHKNVDRISGLAPLKDVEGNAEEVPVERGDRVRKFGTTTRLTTGVVSDVRYQVVLPEDGDIPELKKQIIIEPLQEPVNLGPDGKYRFAGRGDSGAMVVDKLNRIVGLLTRKVDFSGNAQTPDWMGFGGACTDIHRVLDVLKVRGHDLEIPNRLASAPRTAPTRALRPGDSIGTIPRPNRQEQVQQAVLEELKDRMRTFPLGAEIVTAIAVNRPELVQLVHHNRRVKVAWHRAGGPELIARISGGLRDLDQPIPASINGMSVDAVLTAIQTALEAHGSPELVDDLRRFAPGLKAVLPRSSTLRALLENFRTLDRHV